MTERMPKFTIEELNSIIERCRQDEYQMIVCFMHGKASVSLEKGSSYGTMHMKFSADDESVTVAFEKCLVNFPRNPVGAVWDTQRIAPPKSEDVAFTEVGSTDDEIPF